MKFKEEFRQWFLKRNRETVKNIKITLTDWTHECGDSCCTTYGTNVNINGVDLECQNSDVQTILEEVLKHLGYSIEITTEYENN